MPAQQAGLPTISVSIRIQRSQGLAANPNISIIIKKVLMIMGYQLVISKKHMNR